jgi:uncharacterized membrane protein
MSPETSAIVQLLLRWFHIFAGIVWIGHLYFFNFVNVPFQGVLEKELKPRVNPPLILRALWWFRWGAMWTFLFGLMLFGLLYLPPGGFLWDYDGGLSRRGMWMLLGGLLGTIMWFNVWFVIWPAQKKIIGGMTGGTPAPPEVPKRALLFSRINTFLSAPMLIGMIAGSHQDVWSAMPMWAQLLLIVIGLGAVHGAIKTSPKVGTSL